MVHPQRCANLTPPESTQACQLSLCSHWEVSADLISQWEAELLQERLQELLHAAAAEDDDMKTQVR